MSVIDLSPAAAPAFPAATPRPAGRWRAALRGAGLIALPWVLLAVVYTPGTAYFERGRPDPESWYHVFAHYLATYLLWAAFTPGIAALLRRHPLRWPPQFAAVAWHVAFVAVLICVHAFAMGVFDVTFPAPRNPRSYWDNVVENIMYRIGAGVLLYTVTAACLVMLDALRRYHARERSVVQAQLDALKAQLEPHFLFNTLNAVSELVYRDPAAADRVLTQLAGLLRQSLDRSRHEHALGAELALLREYFAIQHTLLGDRLSVRWHVPEALHDAQVPTLLLQPIAENAIRHGVAQLRRGGVVEIAAQRHGDRLSLTMSNDGPPLAQAARDGGVGLANTRARLAALYGARQNLTLSARDGGCEVRIDLPWAVARP